MTRMRWVRVLAALATVALPATALPSSVAAQAPAADFTYQEVMVPMRDGARLQTVILRPVGRTGPLPILLARTPYGVPASAAERPRVPAAMLADGYILVYQSMRGRFKSDGVFTLSTAVHPDDPAATDEATDAFDTIDWLVKNVPANNGRVGMWGVSYPGFAAAVALARPHPALKATAPMAAWTDYWAADDLHRNGALRQSYAADWLYMLQASKTEDADLHYPVPDTYDYFLSRGNAAGVEPDFGRPIPMYRALLDHPDHDAFYTNQRWTDALGKTTVPTLNVAGFWDQEDPTGSWQIYARQKRDDPKHLAQMVAGPWNHGGWMGTGDKLGSISLGSESGTAFQRDILAPFFRYWLHAEGKRPAFAVRTFQSGSNSWQEYAQWPPKGATATALYLHADATLSFDPPAAGEACRDYVSDPANPVPFRRRPMSGTYLSPDWSTWESDDQRFVDDRPDVLTYTSAPLTSDLTVTGALSATLMAGTSGTDSDFVVKLIDVLPYDTQAVPASKDLAPGEYARTLNGYELPVAMEVRRGRYLASDTVPQPLVPGKVVAWDVPLRDHDHVFKAGHRIMVQVQSSWFPVIDRNPQTFVPNIARAPAAAYVKATQRVCAGSRVTLPVMR